MFQAGDRRGSFQWVWQTLLHRCNPLLLPSFKMTAACPSSIHPAHLHHIRVPKLLLGVCHPVVCLIWDVCWKCRFQSSLSALISQMIQLHTGAVLFQHQCMQDACVDLTNMQILNQEVWEGPETALLWAPTWCCSCWPTDQTSGSKGLACLTSYSGNVVLLCIWPLFSSPNDFSANDSLPGISDAVKPGSEMFSNRAT